MMIKNEINPNLQNLIICRDGELTKEFNPTLNDHVLNFALNSITKIQETIKLETKMIIFDMIHHTDYRKVRHQLMEQKKRTRFENQIGIHRV